MESSRRYPPNPISTRVAGIVRLRKLLAIFSVHSPDAQADKACRVTQSESPCPRENHLQEVVRTSRLGDRREYRRGIAFSHGKATRADWVGAFLTAGARRHDHLTSATPI